MATIATLGRIRAAELSDLLLAQASMPVECRPVAVVDVRDDGTFVLHGILTFLGTRRPCTWMCISKQMADIA
jgi:hypothetical protein